MRFETFLGSVFLAIGCTTAGDPPVQRLQSKDGTPLPNELAASLQPGGHGMVVFGDETLYMYHLPMWHGLHAWQIVLEVTFDEAAAAIYRADQDAGEKLHTFAPRPFALARLAQGFSYSGALYRGHFEQGGTPLTDESVTVTVKRLVMVTPLRANGTPLEVPTYRLFGDSTHWFLAHVAARKPDFDQVLSLEPMADVFTTEQLVAGLTVTVPVQAQGVDGRLRPGQSAALVSPTLGGTSATTSVLAETYFSTTDLGQ